VIALAIWGRVSKVWPFQGEASLQDHDSLELALPLSHQQRAGLQTGAISSLVRPTVEASGDILFHTLRRRQDKRFQRNPQEAVIPRRRPDECNRRKGKFGRRSRSSMFTKNRAAASVDSEASDIA
jgi:hypothetical protein